jgi:hypothetical protein
LEIIMNLKLSLKLLACLAATLSVSLLSGCMQQGFASSDEAMTSLVTALRAGDDARIHQILGPDAGELLNSGDPVADKNRIDQFFAAYDQKHQYLTTDDGKIVLAIGLVEWPMPIPVAKNPFNGQWYFDVATGKEEMLNRRIGQNELDTIQICLAMVDAQREYAALDPDRAGGGKPIYAEKLLSDPGRKNGLYWPTAANETPSPLGELVVSASLEGYKRTEGRPTPYHGYCYRLLKSQGPSAPGGAKNYVENGKMTGGFAVVAYPAEYGNSGIMTFMVNQQGILYYRDLGWQTESKAAAMTAFDPGNGWRPVKEGNAILVGP